MYNKCTKLVHSKCWCSTQVDNNGIHIPGKWGDCQNQDCEEQPNNVTQSTHGEFFVFVFHFSHKMGLTLFLRGV